MSMTERIAAFVDDLEQLGPSKVRTDPELHRQIDRLSEAVDALCWEMTDGAPRFRPGRIVQDR